MASLKTAAVITTHWLKKSLYASSKNIKVLDVTWGYNKNGYEDYVKQHIPSSQFWDSKHIEPATRYIPRSLPPLSAFTSYARQHGISPDTHIIIYDQDIQINSARTWWNFRAYGHEYISVLNGGMKQWLMDDGDIESGDVKSSNEGTFNAVLQPHLMVNYEEMQSIVRQQSTQILDTRARENFTGKADEPSNATKVALTSNNFSLPSVMARGHLPGAINTSIDTIMDLETRQYKSPEDIKTGLQKSGFDLDKSITSMCYSGVLACTYAVAAAHAKLPDVAVYEGSWTEFGQRAAEDNLLVKPNMNGNRSSG